MSQFDHRLQLDQIRDGDRLDLSADQTECGSIAERLGLMSLDRLEAHAVLSRDGQKIRATGRVKAALEQACVATGEPVPAHVDEAFDILFLPEPRAAPPEEEVELGANDLDAMFHDGSAIELGSAIVDSLSGRAVSSDGKSAVEAC